MIDVSEALQTVHVRINDAASGQPTPVRLRIARPQGEYFAPFGRLTHFATGAGQDVGGNLLAGGRQFAFIDGSCEVALPAGRLWVEARKGPEYRPLVQEINRPEGKIALRFTIERWIDLRSAGWYSGDTCAHFLSPPAAMLEAEAEDVAVVNVLALQWWTRATPALAGILDFSGQQPALARPGRLVVVNTLNNGARLGVLGLLNCHRAVYPLAMKTAADGQSLVYSWTLADWCDQCHRKGGLVVWSRLSGTEPDLPYGEALADVILGKVDALEVHELDWCKSRHIPWYWLLNCGYRLPLVGASQKMDNTVPLGQVRTYARLADGADFTYRNWIEAVRVGRTFVTNGPLLDFTLNDQLPGAALTLAEGETKVRLRARAHGIDPFERLEVVCNGEVLAGTVAEGEPSSATLEGELEVPASGWWAVRCWGWDRSAARLRAAHSSPIYVQVPGKPPPADPIPRAHLADHLEQSLAWLAGAAVASEKVRADLQGILEAARRCLSQTG